MKFASQLGVDCVYTWVEKEQMNYKYLKKIKKKTDKYGLKLYNIGSKRVGKSASIHLGLDDRDDIIEEFKSFIINLGQAGIKYTTFTWEPAGVWSTGKKMTRKAETRYVNINEMKNRGNIFNRNYSKKELWNNFKYFIREIIPTAEKAGVHLALHPNDPPVESLGGSTLFDY